MPYLAELRTFATAASEPPEGWAWCDGQVLPVAGNDALFSVLGARFGGDGTTTFGLPDLRGRVLVGDGSAGGGDEPAAQPVRVLRTAISLRGALAGSPSTPRSHVPGEVRVLAAKSAPPGWARCEGQRLPSADHRRLADALGSDGTAVALPDLRGRAVAHRAPELPVGTDGDAELPASPVATSGTGPRTPHDADLGTVLHVVALDEHTAERPGHEPDDAWLTEIRAFPFQPLPEHWRPCDGRLLPISENTALFSLLGVTYGGDGRSTFGLPDLRGRVAVHPGGRTAVGTPRPVLPVTPAGGVQYAIAVRGAFPERWDEPQPGEPEVVPPVGDPAAPARDVVAELTTLRELRDAGVLDDAELAAAKALVLAAGMDAVRRGELRPRVRAALDAGGWSALSEAERDALADDLAAVLGDPELLVEGFDAHRRRDFAALLARGLGVGPMRP